MYVIVQLDILEIIVRPQGIVLLGMITSPV